MHTEVYSTQMEGDEARHTWLYTYWERTFSTSSKNNDQFFTNLLKLCQKKLCVHFLLSADGKGYTP